MELEKLINIQLNERYKNFLIHGPALSGKTQLAKKISEKYNCKYISLLYNFTEIQDYKDNIDIFGPADLISYLKKITINDSLVVVDEIDFLINTWSDSQLREFFCFIDKSQKDTCYIFVINSNKMLEKENIITRSDKGTERVFDIMLLGVGY